MQSNNPFRAAADEKTPLPTPDAQYPPPPGPPASGSKQDEASDWQSTGGSSLDHSHDRQMQMRGYPYEGNTTQQASEWPPLPPPSYSAAAPSTSSAVLPPHPASQPYIPPEAHTDVAARSSLAGPSRGPGSAANNSWSRNPVDPLPPSFSRPIAPHLIVPNAHAGYPQLPGFPPMRLYSKEKTLDHGFPILLPPCAVQPHPFAQRDVMEADWIRFLQDLQQTGRPSKLAAAADALPIMRLGLVGMITRVVEKEMKRGKTEPVGHLVDTWNEHFFHARRLHVILARGPENISGEGGGPAPDWQHGRSRSSSCSSSSSSSSFDDTHRGLGLMGREEARHRRRAERRHRKRERREERRGRREERRGRRDERRGLGEAKKHDKYRLVIVSF